MRSVYLQPGEWFFSDRPARIDTILGSCLGIVMRHRGGATCVAHCVLPAWNGDTDESGDEARYVDRCLEKMMSFFDRRGIVRSQLEVKLFGASQLLPGGVRANTLAVGRQNLTAALEILQREGIPVCSQDVGGNRGRKISVNSATGEVTVTYMQPPGAQTGSEMIGAAL
jgi:chemotaxis protein CheD